MAGDDKWSLHTASFPYYVDTSKPKKPSVLSSNYLSNSNTNADLPRVNSFSSPNNARAPTRGRGVFGSDSFLKNIESPRAAHDLAGAGSGSGNRTASSRSGTAPIMPNLLRNGSQAKQKKGINGRSRMLLGHCFDKKSVHVSHQPPRSSSQRAEVDQMVLEESRRSIEVFGSGAAAAATLSMERKLSMLTWDAIPKPQTQTSGNGDDDVASDASSDLFEIENISGPTAAADDGDASSFCTQWSVVTAAAASDYNGDAGISDSKGCKEERKGRQGGILGCRSRKAVDVAQINVASKNQQDKGKLLPALR